MERSTTTGVGEHQCRSYQVAVAEPFRLDLTVNALRRLPSNLVDVFADNRDYYRAFDGATGPVMAMVTQLSPRSLKFAVAGPAADHASTLALVRRMLGLDRNIAAFRHAATRLPWLRPLVRRMFGLRPPQYATIWEAFVNTIAFQQLSLHAASAIVRRLVVNVQPAVRYGEVALYPFPSLERVLGSGNQMLRAAGLSANKIATLQRVADAIGSGALDRTVLDTYTTPQAAAVLTSIKGVGPWTAAVVLLRGLGRLDVFPANDSSVVRNLALVKGPAPADLPRALAALSPEQGMLYYHLLLARLESQGVLSGPRRQPGGGRQ
jgi:DNA-3-methyladenine glycosylase II